MDLNRLVKNLEKQTYALDPFCLESVQMGQIKDWHRAKLLDWMQLVCSSVGFRRQTYYLAQFYVDSMLAKEQQILREL